MRQQARRSDKDSSRHQTGAAKICQDNNENPCQELLCLPQRHGDSLPCASAAVYPRDSSRLASGALHAEELVCLSLAHGNTQFLLGRSFDVRYADCSDWPVLRTLASVILP